MPSEKNKTRVACEQCLRAVLATIFAVFATAMPVQAQEQTTPNVITTTTQQGVAGVQQSWTGFTVTGSTGGGFSGGNQPGYNTSTGQFMFGYSQGTIGYTMAINSALSGSGVQVGGIEYGLTYLNQDFSRGTLTVNASILSNTGVTLQSYSHNLPQTTNGWTQWNQTQTFSNPYSLANLGNATLSFTGKDDRSWAGYYGPQFKDPYLRFNYTADPCVGNPRYSPSCPGYNTDMWYTGDLTSVYGTTFAIQQALGFGNTGVRVHSVNWGYDYAIGGRRCVWDILGLCMEWTDSMVGGSMNVTNASGQQIAYDTNSHSGQNVSGSFRREVLLGSTSPDISSLGNATISTWTSGIASVTPYMGFNFTPDICSTDPLANAQCPGYAAAYLTQQCSANPLYDQSCPGYAQALFTQQCNANQLSNPSCPGYAAAYLTYQCGLNQLYSASCPGYQQAYLNQQCGISPLYSASCTNYQTALNQCTADPLSAAYCPEYSAALAACSANGLAYSYCPTYQTELNYCSTDPLFNNLCPTYQTATASCSANTLNHSYCPGYTTALNTCSTNPLSNTLCSGYTAASNACSANQLTYTYCPSYTTAIAACATNPQGNTMCPGYSSTASSGSGGSPVILAAATTADPVSQAAPLVADPVVNQSITSTATSASPAQAATATVPLVSKPEPAVTTATAVASAAEEKKEEKKEDTKSADSKESSTTTASASSEQKKDQPKTARQEIQERRVAAARAKAVEAGKELANKMGEAASLEAQVAVQNVVIQAMGFTPGFDAYSKAILPDAQGYRPFEIYPGQRVIDNPQGRRFMTGSDRLHAEMVDQQYDKER